MLGQALGRSPKSILLLGPRQVGKSTLVQSLNPDLAINLADQAQFLEFAGNSHELSQRLAAQPAHTVFIDEVQRLPSILNTVQALVDDAGRRGVKLKFYLTGSSARKLRRGGANLLPGRLFTYHLGPLSAGEMGYGVDGRRALEVGFLPEVHVARDRTFQEKLLRSYAGTYLREEIQAEALTRNLEGFSRFIDVAAENAGRVLDFSKMSTKAKVSRQSCVRFFEILEDTLVAQKVLPCPLVEGADLTKHPRFYFFDVGVLNGILGNYVASADRIGILTEHLIFNQIVQSAHAHDEPVEIWGFRTRGGLEIDFLVKLRGRLWAIEVKTGADVTNADVRALQQLATYYPHPYEAVVATLEGSPKKVAGVWILPWQMLLKEMGL